MNFKIGVFIKGLDVDEANCRLVAHGVLLKLETIVSDDEKLDYLQEIMVDLVRRLK